MSIRNKLILFSMALLLLPLTLIAVLTRMLYYRMQAAGELPSPKGHRGAVFDLLVQNYASLLIVVAVLALVLLLIFGLIFLRSMIQPLKQLGCSIEKIEEGNLQELVYYGKHDEFQPLFEQVDKMRIRLRDSMETQVKQEERRRDMIANIAHDLKTPITSIQGYAEGLADGVALTPEKQERYLKIIVEKAGDLNRMAEALYSFSRMELDRMPIEKQGFQAKALMQDMLEECGYGRKGLALESDFSQISAQSRILLDPRQTQRVLGNIIENSCRYASGETVNLSVTAQENEERLIFCFADDGIGLPEEELEKIFERFYRSDSARQNSGEGSGLGLSICKQIQRAQGGEIWARKNKKGGLSIYLSFKKEGDCGHIDY